MEGLFHQQDHFTPIISLSYLVIPIISSRKIIILFYPSSLLILQLLQLHFKCLGEYEKKCFHFLVVLLEQNALLMKKYYSSQLPPS